MRVSRILPYYTGLSIVSLFTGISYDAGWIVIRPFDLMLAVALLVNMGVIAKRGEVRRLEKPLSYYLFAALYLYRGLSGLVMTGPVLALKELIQGFEFLMLIHFVARVTETKVNRSRLLRTLYIGFGLVAVVTAALHIAEGQYSGYKYLPGGEQKYVFGLFGLLAFYYWIGSHKIKFTLPVLGLALILALLSGERKGWVALVPAVLTMYYVQSNFRVWRMLRDVFRIRYLVVVGLVIVGVLLSTRYDYAQQQFENLRGAYELVTRNEFSYVSLPANDAGRYNGLVFVVDALSRYPVFGVGTERGREALNEITTPRVDITIGHGQYQLYALENGIIGLALYTLLWLSLIWKTLYGTNYTRLTNKHHIISCGIIIYSVVINMLMGGGSINLLITALSIGMVVHVR